MSQLEASKPRKAEKLNRTVEPSLKFASRHRAKQPSHNVSSTFALKPVGRSSSQLSNASSQVATVKQRPGSKLVKSRGLP